jgi:hypothetical protein
VDDEEFHQIRSWERVMSFRILTCCLTAVLVVVFPCAGLPAPARGDGLPALKVDGNRLKTVDGKGVRLQGVNIPGLGWDEWQHVLPSLTVAVGEWKANIVRLPLSQDHWFGRAREQKDRGAGYRKIVRAFAEQAAVLKCYVILDLEVSNSGTGGAYLATHKMPDDGSVEFWQDVAKAFANHPAVLFDLYNEPHDVSWETWRNGGQVVENNKSAPNGKLEYHTPGMQKLLDVCRAQGARNVVVAGGLDWGYDLRGIAGRYALDDPKGNGVAYDAHIYPGKNWYVHGKTKSQDWDRIVMSAGKKYPVIIGEFSDAQGGYARKVVEFADQNELPWLAWSLHTTAKPCLIKDWKFTPTAYGQVVKDLLHEAAARR